MKIAEVGQAYAERLYALEAAEPAPKAMPYVLWVYHLEPRTPVADWIPLADRRRRIQPKLAGGVLSQSM